MVWGVKARILQLKSCERAFNCMMLCGRIVANEFVFNEYSDVLIEMVAVPEAIIINIPQSTVAGDKNLPTSSLESPYRSITFCEGQTFTVLVECSCVISKCIKTNQRNTINHCANIHKNHRFPWYLWKYIRACRHCSIGIIWTRFCLQPSDSLHFNEFRWRQFFFVFILPSACLQRPYSISLFENFSFGHTINHKMIENHRVRCTIRSMKVLLILSVLLNWYGCIIQLIQ